MIDNGFITRYHSLPIAYHSRNYIYNDTAVKTSETFIHTSLHNHKEFEILCFEEGIGNMIIDGTLYELHSGDILIINPMETHYGEYPTNQKQFKYFCVDFDTELIGSMNKQELTDEELKKTFIYRNYIPYDHPQNPILTELLKDLYNSLCAKPTGWEYKIRGQLLIFISILMENNLTTTRSAGLRSQKKGDFIKNILTYIENHYNEPITSQDLANEFSYNHCYFCRMFKMTFNKSFSDYLNIFRVCKARDLLEQTSHTITNIAVMAGFSSNSYFSQMFKKYIGVLPSEYRKLYSDKTEHSDSIQESEEL